jgi:hypothetical protein
MSRRAATAAGRQVFELAPMSSLIRGLTLGLLALPFVVLAAAWAAGTPAPAALVVAPLLLLYAAVWLWWRPTRFVLSEHGLEIVFPARRKQVARAELGAGRIVSAAAFRAEFGFAVRIGVGGLWGGFGWLWTRRRGMVEFYVSRTDGLLLLERRGGRPLLITPVRPEALAAAL